MRSILRVQTTDRLSGEFCNKQAVGEQVATPKSARLLKQAKQPLQSTLLHPGGRHRFRASVEVKRGTDAYLHSVNLVGMIRQMYFECLLHLHTIQRLKRAQGLRAVVQIPREGYLLLPAFSGEPEASDRRIQ